MSTPSIIGYSKPLWCRHVDYEMQRLVKVEFTLLVNHNVQLRVVDAQTHGSTQTGMYFVSLSAWTASTCCLFTPATTPKQAAEWAFRQCQWRPI